MVTEHAGDVAADLGEAGQPAGLLGHPHVGADHVELALGIDQQPQRVGAAERVPDLIAHVEIGLSGVHPAVVAAEVAALLGDGLHPAHITVERGVEDAALRLAPALDPDLAERGLPLLPGLLHQFGEGAVGPAPAPGYAGPGPRR